MCFSRRPRKSLKKPKMKLSLLLKILSVINLILVIFLILDLTNVLTLPSSVYGILLISVGILTATGIYLKENNKK
tara:strand:+ start:31 stop:255 length:225 start_codon:yes stop_codon:yes gene_type:complete